MEELDLSIIIPIYNIQNYILECVNTLLESTFLNYEIILVNDGSTDESLTVIKNIAYKKKNIKIIDKKNGGLSSARNAGLSKASGKYIFFVDGDDFISIKSIEKMFVFAEEKKLDIAIGNGKYYFEDKSNKNNYFIQGKKLEQIKSVLTGEEVLEFMINNSCYKMEVWDKLYSRRLLIDNNIKFEEGLLHEDEMFTPIAFKYAEKVAYYGNIDYNYRQRQGSINQTVKLQNCLDYLKIADNFYDKCYVEQSIGKYFGKRIIQQYLRGMQLSLSLCKEDYLKFEIELKNSNMDLIKENFGFGITFRIKLFKYFRSLYKVLYLNYRKIRFVIVGKV